MNSPSWLIYALATTLLWGVWGAFTNLPAEHGFPETLIDRIGSRSDPHLGERSGRR